MRDAKKRLRRTMMFLNAQKPGLIKDPYIYGADSLMLDLEDAVAENQKDAARFSLFHALRTIDYHGAERIVRINGLDTPFWKEDIRCAVAGGCDGIRIPKTETAQDVKIVEQQILKAENEFGRPENSTLIMAAIESARGVVKALEICEASKRLFGIALSGGDYTKDLHTHITGTGIELMGARQQLVIAARAAGVQCFDTVYTDLENEDGFREDVNTIHLMGFDGKSIINPRQIRIVHEIFTPKEKEIIFAEKVVREIDSKKAQGIGVFTVDGKMIDIAFYDGAKRTIELAKASGVRGEIGKAISEGKLKGLAVMRSHGGRVRAIETGEVHLDIAFIGAPTCDDYGNCRGIGGKADCGVLSYAMVDADYADRVVAITDCLVPFPNFPAHISMTKVDYVVVVDAIGDPKKIATGAAKPTKDMRKLMMADYCTRFVASTPYFKDGFSYQTGVGGASIASTISLAKIMKERGIRMRFGVGGLTKPMCDLLDNNQVDVLLDTQDFDLDAVESVKDIRHFRISAGEYADPFNKGAVVNKLDFVILAALEVDVNFNCNVVVGSDGVITGAQGGHPDTAAGAKCTIVLTPLLQGRIPAICTEVTTVTTPGESVDVVITEYGVAVNPLRKDLLEAVKNSGLPLKTIEELRDLAYRIAGEPEKVEFGERVVGIIESRDGTIMDVVRQIKPFRFKEEKNILPEPVHK